MKTLRLSLLLLLSPTVLLALGQAPLPQCADSLALHADSLTHCNDSLARRMATLGHRLDSVINASPLSKTAQVGVMVWDLQTDSCLYSRGATTVVRPASAMKLLTAVAALQAMGDSAMVAADSTDNKLVADFSMKDTVALGEGWCWDDDNPQLNVLDTTLCPHPLAWLLKPMLKASHNLAAEAVFYTLAAWQAKAWAAEANARQKKGKARQKAGKVAEEKPVGSRQAQRSVEMFIRSLKDSTPWLQLESDGVPLYRVADGSGLSLYNYVTPQLLVACLRYAWRSDSIRTTLCQSLPIAGVDGTLEDRMKASPVAGQVLAKTGTLSGVSSLAGYWMGRPLAFCIVVNGTMRQRPARDLQDRLCQEFGR